MKRVLGTTAAILLVLVVLGGCGDAGEQVPLELVSYSPLDGATDVPVDTAVTIEAAADLDIATVNAEAFTLTASGAASPVEAEIAISTTTATLTPTANLAYETEYTVAVAGTVADTEGNTLEGGASWSFTTAAEEVVTPQTAAITVTVTTPSGDPLANATVTIDGETAGPTNTDGLLSIADLSVGTTYSVAASRTFFVDAIAQDVTLEAGGSAATIALNPQIFIPDYGNGRIVRIDDMDGTNRTELSEIPGDPEPHTLVGPIDVHVDYENGVLYVLDQQPPMGGSYENPSFDSVAAVIKLTAFPPASAAETEVVLLGIQMDPPPPAERAGREVGTITQGPTENIGSQITVDTDGSILIADFAGRRIIRIPSSLDFAEATFSAPSLEPFGQGATGVAVLPDGDVLAVASDMDAGPELIALSPAFDAFEHYPAVDTFGSGSGDWQFSLATRPVMSPDGSYVYVGDTGQLDDSGSYSAERDNSRIVRMSADGPTWATYGDKGSGDGQFNGPLLLGVLPDGLLYVMDAENDRLVRFSPAAFDEGAAEFETYAPTDASAFLFEYWYYFPN